MISELSADVLSWRKGPLPMSNVPDNRAAARPLIGRRHAGNYSAHFGDSESRM